MTPALRSTTASFWDAPYAAVRHPPIARRMVSTTHPLATQAALAMLAQGGNAVDAALAAAIALVVVEPVSTGLGSDLFALVGSDSGAEVLNATGRAPMGWTEDVLSRWEKIPARGWNSVTVPGAVAGWLDLSRRYGKLDYASLFAPALRYAEEGFVITPGMATRWQVQVDELASQPGFAQAFMPYGRAPRAGEHFRLEGLARSLCEIAESRNASFYQGRLAECLAADARLHGAHLTVADMAAHRNDWSQPLTMSFAGHEVLQPGPNGQGIAVLIALGILEKLNINAFLPDSSEALHLQIEALKLAFADVQRYLSDPASMELSAQDLLSHDYLESRSRLVDMKRAGLPGPGLPLKGGTVHVAVGDENGLCVSLIQSNFVGFGSGVVVPGTGISLQNRASGFTLEPSHPNHAAAGKRPFHTITPGMVLRDGKPVLALGVTGGNMQPQGQVQLLNRMLGCGQNPQTAIDAPRFRITAGRAMNLEPAVPDAVKQALLELGHQVEPLPSGYMDFGCAQAVSRLGACWVGGADARKDGTVAGY